MSRWAIIGDGAWGHALSRQLSNNEHSVQLVGVDSYRGDLPERVSHSVDHQAVLKTTERIILAVPIGVLESALRDMGPYLCGHHRVLTTARGLTPESNLRGLEAVLELTPIRQVGVLAGAALAENLQQEQAAALVIGSAFTQWAGEAQSALSSPSLRIYTNPDPVGVELANALALVLAVALAAARAMGVGAATVATAQTRALAEMDRLVQGLGGDANTAFGLAGLGVIATLVFEDEGQTLAAGRALAAGDRKALSQFKELREVARTLAARANSQSLRAPMLSTIDNLLAGRVGAREALGALMNRATRAE